MRTLLFLVALAGCTRESARSADPPNRERPPSVAPAKEAAVNPLDALLLGSADSVFLAQVDKAGAVFVGQLGEVGAPPPAYSGYNVATQALTYEVVRVLRGDVAGPRITVHHM